MNSALLKSIRSHSLMLGTFAVVTALLLALVFKATENRIILQKQEAERRALIEVLPPAQHDNDLLADSFLIDENSAFQAIALLGLSQQRSAYIARLNGEVSGIIIPVEAHDGYSGDILLLVGINADASLSGIRVLSHKETPGLGDKIDLRVSDWILSFTGHSLNNPAPAQWQVKKDDGEFDQFVGATITPRAVVKAVKNALLFFEENREQISNL
jgi:Na+-translocating ferredoxin:NAD+ oxidoreductase subunit G